MHRNDIMTRYHRQLREAYAYLIMGACNDCYSRHDGELPPIAECERCKQPCAVDMLDVRREIERTGCDLSGLALWA